MYKLKPVFLVIIFIAAMQYSYSQQLKINNKHSKLFFLTQDTTSPNKNNNVNSKKRNLESFFNFGFGIDPSAYLGYNVGIAFNYKNKVDMRIGVDGYTNVSIGGTSHGYSLLTLSGYSAGYVYERTVKLAAGAGLGILLSKPPTDKSRFYPYVSFKADHFLGETFGIGGEVKFYVNNVYSNSSFLFFLNFTFRQ